MNCMQKRFRASLPSTLDDMLMSIQVLRLSCCFADSSAIIDEQKKKKKLTAAWSSTVHADVDNSFLLSVLAELTFPSVRLGFSEHLAVGDFIYLSYFTQYGLDWYLVFSWAGLGRAVIQIAPIFKIRGAPLASPAARIITTRSDLICQ